MRLKILLVVPVFFLYVGLWSAEAAYDPRAARLLRQASFVYEIDADDDFRVLVKDGDKSILVLVNSQTSTYINTEVREIWCIVHSCDGNYSTSVTTALLKRNGALIMGAWQIKKTSTGQCIIFSLKIDADLQDAEKFKAMMAFVGVSSMGLKEELEKDPSKIWEPFPNAPLSSMTSKIIK